MLRRYELCYSYTDPYAFNEARVFVRKGEEFTFTSFDDLKGKVGSIPAGGSFGEAFDTFAKENSLALERVENKDQMVAMVLAGHADYFIQDLMDATIFLQAHGQDGAMVALPMPVSTTGVHMAFSPLSPCAALVPQVNAIIAKARQDGTLDRIIQDNPAPPHEPEKTRNQAPEGWVDSVLGYADRNAIKSCCILDK